MMHYLAALMVPVASAAILTSSAAPSIGQALEARSTLPSDAVKWRRELTRSAQLEWGLDAPVAMMGAQIHQESAWDKDAQSAVGAKGMAQFMPATATWLAGVRATVGPADPYNPVWALRAMAAYDKLLWDDSSAVNACNHAAKMLSAYNGGLRWIERDEVTATKAGLRSDTWFDHVETVNSGRSSAAWSENRAYPRRILLVLEPRYVAAGWSTTGVCAV